MIHEVVLIPTGKMEHLALGPALQRLFPGVSFAVRPPTQPLNGFTSGNVTHPPANPHQKPPDEELAEELINSVYPGRRGSSPTIAIVIEDLELANDHQPAAVVARFRASVQRVIDRDWNTPYDRHRVLQAAQERCSFHLFRPMTEAYFFGEQAALTRANVIQTPQLQPNSDLEKFATVDATYSALPTGLKKDFGIADHPDRPRHPKSYLNFLCAPNPTFFANPPYGRRKPHYKEGKNGVAALEQLDWQQVLSDPNHCPFLRAFLDDLAQAVGQPLTWLTPPSTNPGTQFPGPSDRILRNL